MARRRARREDIHEIAMGLPQVESSTSGAGLPSYSVGGRAFVFFREPRKDALDPETGERMEDVIAFHVGDLADKEALVQADGPFFTTPHWNGYRAVLLRERHLGQLSRRELEEVITDAWVARAPNHLAKDYLGEP